MPVEVKDVASAVNFNYYYHDEDNCNLQAVNITECKYKYAVLFLRFSFHVVNHFFYLHGRFN